MRVLSTGMKWEDLEIRKDQKGFPEIHYTSVFRAFQGWVNDEIFDKIFEASVMKLFQEELVSVQYYVVMERITPQRREETILVSMLIQE